MIEVHPLMPRRVLALHVLLLLACTGALADGKGARPTGAVLGAVHRAEGPVVAEVAAYRHPPSAWDFDGSLQGLESVMDGWQSVAAFLVAGPVMVPLPEPLPAAPWVRDSTDGQGRFALRGLAAGQYTLRATTADGQVGSTILRVPVEGAVREQHLLLGEPRLRRVQGRIRHRDGRPYRGQVAAFHASMGTTPASPGVATDADGRFTLEVEEPRSGAGALRLGALDPLRWAVLWPIPPRDDPRGAALDAVIDVVVDAGTQPRCGRVVDACTCRPIAGATVLLVQGEKEGQPVRYQRTRTDGRGAFRLTQTGREEPRVFVTAHGYRLHMGAWERGLIRLTPLARTRFHARVVLPAGTDLPPDLRVGVWGEELLGSVRALKPDALGRVAFDLEGDGAGMLYAVGRGWFSAGVADYILGREDALPRLDPRAEGEIALPLVRAGRVEGRVTGPDGRPVVGALLRLDLDHGTEQHIGGRPPGTEGLGRYAATDEEGRYALDTLVPGLPYRVDVDAVGLAPTTICAVRAASGATFEAHVKLAPFGSLELTLLDDASGMPVAGAGVTLYFTGSSSMHTGDPSARTDAQGRLRFERLRDEPVVATVIADGYAMLEGAPVPTASGAHARHTLRLKRS